MSKYLTKPFNPIEWPALPHDFGSDNLLGIRSTDATQRYVYGTRYTTWDGRVYKYFNAVAGVSSYHGAGNAEVAAVTYVVLPVDAEAGQNHIIVTLGSRAEDDLAGSYLIIYDKSSTAGLEDNLNYGILGNSNTTTTTDIYLDGNLPVKLLTSDAVEVFENPYRELTHATDSYAFWAGIPARSQAAGYKGWVQTWGPCVVSGGENVGAPGADTRELVWGSNATLYKWATKEAAQRAGCIMTGSSAAYGPLIMLQCST